MTAVLTALLTACMWSAAAGQGERLSVTLVADNQPVRDVAAIITEQTGVQVAVTDTTSGSVTGKLAGAGVEDSVALLAAGAHASWLRAYIIERRPPDTPYTAEELLDKLDGARRALWESLGRGAFWQNLTEEERHALLVEWRARAGSAAEPTPAGPAAGDAPARAQDGDVRRGMPGGAVAQMDDDAEPGDAMRYDDPVRDLLMPARSDAISLNLSGVPLAQAVREFTLQSGFLVVVDEALDGVVTLRLDGGEPGRALDAFADAAGAQWRPFYVLSRPRELSAEEVAGRQQQFQQRRREMITRAAAEFWQLPAEERAEHVQTATRYLDELPPDRRERIRPLVTRALPFFVAYAATLTTEQRLELKPLLQALARVAGQ